MHPRHRGFAAAQRHERHLRRCAEPERNAPVAGAGADVEQRALLRVRAHRVLEEGRREAPAELRQGELPPVRVTAQRERHAALRERGPERRIVREGDRRRPSRGRARARARRRARRATCRARRPRDRRCRRARASRLRAARARRRSPAPCRDARRAATPRPPPSRRTRRDCPGS